MGTAFRAAEIIGGGFMPEKMKRDKLMIAPTGGAVRVTFFIILYAFNKGQGDFFEKT